MTDRVEDPLIEEALRWFVVLRDDSHDENDRRAFERWRATDAAHEAAWQRARAAGHRPTCWNPSMADRAAPSSRRFPTPRGRRAGWDGDAGCRRRRSPRSLRRRLPGQPAGPVGRPSDGGGRAAHGDPGRRLDRRAGRWHRPCRFPSARTARRLRLVAGEAFFTVAPDSARPFIVEAAKAAPARSAPPSTSS